MNRGGLFIGRLLRHRGAVVVNHAPTVGIFLKDISGQNARGDLLAFDRAIEVFVERHPSQLSINFNFHVGQSEVDRRRVLENTAPALHNRFPPAQDAPARMTALNFAVFGPKRFHPFDIETFEGAVKGQIGVGHFLFIGSHKNLMLRLGSNEHQGYETPFAAVKHTVILAGGCERDFSRT
jgi:hypothetical protein